MISIFWIFAFIITFRACDLVSDIFNKVLLMLGAELPKFVGTSQKECSCGSEDSLEEAQY